MFDPYYAFEDSEQDVTDTELGVDQVDSIRAILKRFYNGKDLENGMSQVYEIVLKAKLVGISDKNYAKDNIYLRR